MNSSTIKHDNGIKKRSETRFLPYLWMKKIHQDDGAQQVHVQLGFEQWPLFLYRLQSWPRHNQPNTTDERSRERRIENLPKAILQLGRREKSVRRTENPKSPERQGIPVKSIGFQLHPETLHRHHRRPFVLFFPFSLEHKPIFSCHLATKRRAFQPLHKRRAFSFLLFLICF